MTIFLMLLLFKWHEWGEEKKTSKRKNLATILKNEFKQPFQKWNDWLDKCMAAFKYLFCAFIEYFSRKPMSGSVKEFPEFRYNSLLPQLHIHLIAFKVCSVKTSTHLLYHSSLPEDSEKSPTYILSSSAVAWISISSTVPKLLSLRTMLILGRG